MPSSSLNCNKTLTGTRYLNSPSSFGSYAQCFSSGKSPVLLVSSLSFHIKYSRTRRRPRFWRNCIKWWLSCFGISRVQCQDSLSIQLWHLEVDHFILPVASCTLAKELHRKYLALQLSKTLWPSLFWFFRESSTDNITKLVRRILPPNKLKLISSWFLYFVLISSATWAKSWDWINEKVIKLL